ncbi:MAG: putative Ig domain-containing protein, partial [bacterium]
DLGMKQIQFHVQMESEISPSEFSASGCDRINFLLSANEGEPLLAIQDGQNIDESNIGVDLTGLTEDRAVTGCNGDSDGYGNGLCYLIDSVHWNGKEWRAGSIYFQDTPGPYYKNDWHLVEAYFKLNNIIDGKGIADGVLQYWYDGELIIDHHDVMMRTGQHADMKFNQFIIGPWIGDGSPVAQTFWVDNLIVANSPPEEEPQNHAPILDSIGNKIINSGYNLNFTVTATDQDTGDSLTYSIDETLPQGANFLTQVFSWTPEDSQSGTYHLTFRVVDSSGVTDHETISITVKNVDDSDPESDTDDNGEEDYNAGVGGCFVLTTGIRH